MPNFNITVESTFPTQKQVLVQVEADSHFDALRKALTIAKKHKEWPADVQEMSTYMLKVTEPKPEQGVLVC